MNVVAWLTPPSLREQTRTKSTYKKQLDGCDKLAARPFKHSPSTNFGGSGPRFNDYVYIPSVRSIHTDSPGPKYMPVDVKRVRGRLLLLSAARLLTTPSVDGGHTLGFVWFDTLGW